jgi:preprotein translocase subunit Sec61beta
VFRDEKQFEDRIVPMLRAGLQKYYEEVEEEDGKLHETKVSFLCGYNLDVCTVKDFLDYNPYSSHTSYAAFLSSHRRSP